MDLATGTDGTSAARSNAYRVLSWGHQYPERERWTDWLDWKSAVQNTFAELDISAHRLLDELDRLPTEEGSRLLALQKDYTRLFINAVPKVLAPPYASAYADDGLLMGRPAEAAMRAYRRAGLEFSPVTHELPDHVAVELEFMHYLTRQESECEESGDSARAAGLREQQRQFLQDDLLSWVPVWRRRVEMAERSGIYMALAEVTENWLYADAGCLDMQRVRDLEGVIQ